MKRWARRLIFYPLLAAFAGSLGWWTVRVPHRPDRIFRAIPAEARFVSVHRRLAARWPALSASPFAHKAAEQFGLEPAAWERMRLAPGLTRWIDGIVPEQTVFARLVVGDARRTAWVGASWIGGRSQKFRWMLSAGKVPGITKFGDYAGRQLWLWKTAGLPDGLQVSFALEEGLVIACLSPHASDVCRALDAYDGHVPSLRGATRGLDASAPDCGFWDLGAGPGPDHIQFAFTRFDARGVRGRATVGGWDADFPAGVAAADARGLDAVLGGRPETLLMADPAWLRVLLPPVPTNRAWATEAWRIVDEQTTGDVAVAMFGDALNGRFRGLRVPGFVAAARVKDEAAFETAFGASLDRLNAQYRWGLIRGTTPDAPGQFALESTAGNEYAQMPAAERLAYAVTNGWLLFGSNAETLRRLLAGEGLPTGGVVRTAADWTPPAGAAASVWTDLDRGSRTLRLSLSVYDLKLLIENAERNAPARARIRSAKNWLAAFSGFDHARLRVERSPVPTALDVEFEMAIRETATATVAP